MPGFESFSIPLLGYYVQHGKWAKLEIDPITGKHVAVGPGGRPRIFAAAINGTKGTLNHRGQALTISHLASPDDEDATRRIIAFLRDQIEHGHMGNEFGSPSHCDEHYVYLAALAMRSPSAAVRELAVLVLAVELRICARCAEPVRRGNRGRVKMSVVLVGARAWSDTKQPWRNGGAGASEQHSYIRDAGILRWGLTGRPPTPGEWRGFVGPDRVVMEMLTCGDMPWRDIGRLAGRVDLESVAVVAPVYEQVSGATVTRWWHPPTGVTKVPPTVHTAHVANGADFYTFEPVDWTGGERIIGRPTSAT